LLWHYLYKLHIWTYTCDETDISKFEYLGDVHTSNVWFEGELYVNTRIRDVLPNVTAKQRFSHLPATTNAHIQVVTMVIIVTDAPVASTAVFCVAIRTTREHVKHQ